MGVGLWILGGVLMFVSLVMVAWVVWIDYLCRKKGHAWVDDFRGHHCRRCYKRLEIED